MYESNIQALRDRIVSKLIKSNWYRDAIHMWIATCETAEVK